MDFLDSRKMHARNFVHNALRDLFAVVCCSCLGFFGTARGISRGVCHFGSFLRMRPALRTTRMARTNDGLLEMKLARDSDGMP